MGARRLCPLIKLHITRYTIIMKKKTAPHPRKGNEPLYWLMKSEPECYSIDDLKRDKQAEWDGVRNYQARNFMRDDMKKGDLVLYYHSNTKPTGIVGVAKVCKEAYPDHTAWDKTSDHPDPKSTPENPIWFMVAVCFEKKFKEIITLDELKADSAFGDMLVTQRGMRLSVQPVHKKHFDKILKMSESQKSI